MAENKGGAQATASDRRIEEKRQAAEEALEKQTAMLFPRGHPYWNALRTHEDVKADVAKALALTRRHPLLVVARALARWRLARALARRRGFVFVVARRRCASVWRYVTWPLARCHIAFGRTWPPHTRQR